MRQMEPSFQVLVNAVTDDDSLLVHRVAGAVSALYVPNADESGVKTALSRLVIEV